MLSSPVSIPMLTPLVRHALRAHAEIFGLNTERVTVTYVLNWGGFGIANYTAGDGARRIHLKLAPDLHSQAALRRWQGLHTTLEERYHAPAMLGWLTVDCTTYEGPVFEFIEGVFLDGFARPDVLNELLRVVGLLHADRELAETLTPEAPSRSYFDCLVSRYTSMLREDLETVRAEPPPFISQARLRWMSEQVDVLERLAQDSEAFRGAARAVVHWDLWWNNILVSPGGGWYILDWDEIGPGDPAMDFANAIFPLTCGPATRPWQDFPIPIVDEMFSTRMALYRRAQVLDGVIDVLADWIECRVAPAVQAEVRTRKQQEHEQFLRLYEAEYGGE